MGEGSASGVPWGDGLGTGDVGRLEGASANGIATLRGSETPCRCAHVAPEPRRDGGAAPDLKYKPGSFGHEGGHIFFGCEAQERLRGPTLSVIGSDTVIYSSDWPHWDGDYPASLCEIQQRQDLTEEQRHGVLYRAAERFYGRA